MRRVVFGAAVAACAAVAGADTCSSVASSTSIEIKKRFELRYTSELSFLPSTISGACLQSSLNGVHTTSGRRT